MSSIFNKLRKPIKAFKSFIGKGSNAKEYTTIAAVFHGLRTSINDSLNGKNGKDVSFDTVDGTENKSTLHYETDPEVVRELLKKGIDPNTENKNGETALEVTGNFEIAKMLLEHGATRGFARNFSNDYLAYT